MYPERKKSSYILWFILGPMAGFFGYLLSGLFLVSDLSFVNYQEHLMNILKHPLTNYWNEKSRPMILLALLIWLVALMNYYVKASLNTMHGAEHGTSKWGNIKAFNREFSDKDPKNNRILTEHARISYDAYKTELNNNQVIVGGSGAGKTAYVMSPNLLQFHGSNVYTDPKGGLLEDFGKTLERQGVDVRSINLCEMEKSMRYNPFEFIRKASDVAKLITNIIANTSPVDGGNSGADPFWEKAEKLYLQALFNYVWLECPRVETDDAGNEYVLERTFRTILKLMDEAAVSDEEEESALDIRMRELAQRSSLGDKHPAVSRYNRCIRGAADTIRSIIISANSRFDPFDDPELLKILDGNDIDIAALGVGKNGDSETRTSLFMIIPDDDDTFNFIPGMLYTQIFQELYLQARYFGGKLPIDVGFWFDEFANIKMPSMFEKILATCRSRGIYCTIVLQSLAQIKQLFKNGAWEGLVGNCDTFIYLGGNEQSTWKYVSEMLGKWTIDKKTTGQSKGRQGSSSENYDVLGRELLTEAEIRKLNNKKCICFIRGQDPLFDSKWRLWTNKEYLLAKALGKYSYDPIKKEEEMHSMAEDIAMINEASLEYYKKVQKKEKNIDMYQVDLGAFLAYDFDKEPPQDIENLQEALKDPSVLEKLNNYEEVESSEELDMLVERYLMNCRKYTLLEMIANDMLLESQKKIMQHGLEKGLEEETIKTILNPAYSKEQMEELINTALLLKQNRA